MRRLSTALVFATITVSSSLGFKVWTTGLRLGPRGRSTPKFGSEGTSGSTRQALVHHDDESNRSSARRRKGMSVALIAVYFTVMGAKCALPAALPLLSSPATGLSFPLSDTRSPQRLIQALLGYSTLAVAAGKLILGPVIDHFGGILSLKVALTLLFSCLAVISTSQHFAVFATCWIFVDFIFSSCWAACINAIHQSFPEHEWAGHIGSLAVAARCGNAVAFAVFASVLRAATSRMKQPWRPIFLLSALFQLIPIVLLDRFGGPSVSATPTTSQKAPQRSPTLAASLTALSREAQTPVFWLHLLSRSVLMVFASFLLFVSTLMSQVYSASPAFSSQVSSLYAVGCFVAVTFGAQRYAFLPRQVKQCTLLCLLGTAVLCSTAQLCHVAGVRWCQLNPVESAATMFLWGLAFALPFYIPPSLYALRHGGRESSATIADVFDTAGFALLAPFNWYVAGIPAGADSTAWIPVFQVTTACSAISLASLLLAIEIEEPNE